MHQHVSEESIHLIVTSPPYPMIEMWDEMFAAADPSIRENLGRKPDHAFDAMHEVLEPVWQECARSLVEGGILCINIGDATRTIDGTFRLFPNHARIIESCTRLGLQMLPGIIWRKSTNKPNKFMGGGMLGLNAYVTLEHEHILIFRKGERRRLSPDEKKRRRESAYFWEERNQWFSDVWTDLRGTSQGIENGSSEMRSRSAAFPLELPLRLIRMYALYGDTVLDPFAGTGTTLVAASVAGCNSVGYEIVPDFVDLFGKQMRHLPTLSVQHNVARISNHSTFVADRHRNGKEVKHQNVPHDIPVITNQEKGIQLYTVANTEALSAGTYSIGYVPAPVYEEDFLSGMLS